MFDTLAIIDDQLDYKKPFVLGCCMDGKEASFELMDANVLKWLMLEKGYFLLIYDEEFYSISHSWGCGGIFGSFIVQHHILHTPGTTFRQLDICDCFPSTVDLLSGGINAFQKIADVIIETFYEDGSIMQKHRKDLFFLKNTLELNGTLDDDLKSLFEAIGFKTDLKSIEETPDSAH